MKIIKICEMLALVFALASIFIITFFLAEWDTPFYFIEEIRWVRNTEIIISLFAIPFLVYMIKKKVVEMGDKK